MQKKTVKRCVRPQCMEIYEETEKNKICMCGAPLQIVEIEIKSKKSAYKKPAKPKVNYVPKPVEEVKTHNEAPEKESEELDFFETDEQDIHENDETGDGSDVPVTKAFLYLLLEDEDVEFELSNITRIGRVADGVQVDIDLSEYAGKEVSRNHAVIRKEKDGYYITNVSRNHSVRIMDQDDNEASLEYGKKMLLKTGDGIILSKKILLQFEEAE